MSVYWILTLCQQLHYTSVLTGSQYVFEAFMPLI